MAKDCFSPIHVMKHHNLFTAIRTLAVASAAALAAVSATDMAAASAAATAAASAGKVTAAASKADKIPNP